MAVTENKQSQESKEQEQANVQAKTKDFIDGLVNSLDLEKDEVFQKRTADDRKSEEKEETEETEEEEPTEETEETETEEESGEETEEVEESEESDDESEEKTDAKETKEEKITEKLKKRIDYLTAKLKVAEAKAIEQEAKEGKSKDPDKSKLEKMTVEELKNLKRQVRIAQVKSNASDEDLEKLLALEEKIDDEIINKPTSFVNKQIRALQEKAQELINTNDDIDFNKNAEKILSIAKEIYGSHDELTKMEKGQAIALELALERFKTVNKVSNSKVDVDTLKRENLKLKKKTSLDSGSLKGNMGNSKLDSLRKKAFRGSNSYDKENLIKFDPKFNLDNMIPDEYKK